VVEALKATLLGFALGLWFVVIMLLVSGAIHL